MLSPRRNQCRCVNGASGLKEEVSFHQEGEEIKNTTTISINVNAISFLFAEHQYQIVSLLPFKLSIFL